MSLPFKDWIIGVGIDSAEKNNPPVKFEKVFAKARENGYKITAHCDVNQDNTLVHIDQCLSVINVDRIDHGINCLQDDKLWKEIKERGLGLTVCPVSNQFVVQTLTADEIRSMLSKDMLVTINSDDPSYFRAYLNDNFIGLHEEAGFTQDEISTLVKNAFQVAWIDQAKKDAYIGSVDAYIAQA